jgi:hypothetical protein
MKVRANLAATHIGPETLEEAVQDYINRNTDLCDLTGMVAVSYYNSTSSGITKIAVIYKHFSLQSNLVISRRQRKKIQISNDLRYQDKWLSIRNHFDIGSVFEVWMFNCKFQELDETRLYC